LEADPVIRAVYLLRSLGLNGVLLLRIGIVNRTEIVRIGIDGSHRVADIGERGERPFRAASLGVTTNALRLVGIKPERFE